MNKIEKLLGSFDKISTERKVLLEKIILLIQEQKNNKEPINLLFICTHNSRRSHFAQVWAAAAAHYFNLKNVFCYSGGTEVTVLFPVVHQTLSKNGFSVQQLSFEKKPIYALKHTENSSPIICFSKIYNDKFNPENNFFAIMTCAHAEKNCPFIPNAKQRISLPYNDPKEYDNTPFQAEKYAEIMLEIAREMVYIFSKIK